MRKFGRTDLNQGDLVKAARGVGASVWITSALGGGGPDAVIGYKGINYMTEFKDGAKSPSARILTPEEACFHRTWNGRVSIIESTEQLYRLLGVKL